MKRRSIDIDQANDQAERQLATALSALKDADQVQAFLRDLCTPAELEALTDRWRVVPLLLDEVPYREIHDRTGVSITTIGRVARFITQGNGGYLAAARATREASVRNGANA
ncbi:YerC/YecD family TrpR-related protein [Oleiagrimonas sp. C23AA]|uniref:YerC/YecD family TrpR-related protein n=1 Tax=Oleiagrimonas sp. C23AA TaxID=2719047 RepID=UPI001423C670|nr:YerC/YecD family TrpR-related protein [Oleiagrimonas sp. C23AA]NII10330.1 hypothetical protein [Oleiagrimonas sp. C23AA]